MIIHRQPKPIREHGNSGDITQETKHRDMIPATSLVDAKYTSTSNPRVQNDYIESRDRPRKCGIAVILRDAVVRHVKYISRLKLKTFYVIKICSRLLSAIVLQKQVRKTLTHLDNHVIVDAGSLPIEQHRTSRPIDY